MAVYTKVSAEEIKQFLKQRYGITEPFEATGLAEGIENTNYLLSFSPSIAQDKPSGKTSGKPHRRLILTIFEERVDPKDLPFFLKLMEHLYHQNLPCALPVADVDARHINSLRGKPAVLVNFLEGKATTDPTVAQCRAVGSCLGELHALGGDFAKRFGLKRANSVGVRQYHKMRAAIANNPPSNNPAPSSDGGTASNPNPASPHSTHRTAPHHTAPHHTAPHHTSLDPKLLTDAIKNTQAHWSKLRLPEGIIHGDLFPDNVLFTKAATIGGVIDFYFACEDFLAYDLAITLNAWCFREHPFEFFPSKAEALVEGYQTVRPLEASENAAMPFLLKAAAIRFWLTRLIDKASLKQGKQGYKEPAVYQQIYLFENPLQW